MAAAALKLGGDVDAVVDLLDNFRGLMAAATLKPIDAGGYVPGLWVFPRPYGRGSIEATPTPRNPGRSRPISAALWPRQQ